MDTSRIDELHKPLNTLYRDESDLQMMVVEQVDNLDDFFQSMYRFYVAKGLGATILSQLCSLLSLGFTIVFSIFLIAFVDWPALLSCRDEATCGENKSITLHLISPFDEKPPTLFNFLIVIYFLLFSIMWIFQCYNGVNVIYDAFNMEKFYREKLGIQQHDVQNFEWYEIIERLQLLYERRVYRINAKDTLNAHDVVLRIMRKENYLIGLINENVLDLVVPWWVSIFFCSRSDRLFLTKSLEWSLSFCILEYMFDEKFHISSEFLSDAQGLKWRFQVVGLIHLILLPFMLIFMSIHFFLQNVQHFHSSKAYLGPRQWSPLALWQFREYNELPHIFEQRINRSISPANRYIALFHNTYLEIVARCVAYICGAFVATLLLVSVLSEDSLLYIHIGEHNLLWYLGIFSATYAVFRSFIPDDSKAREAPDDLMKEICIHTHIFPEKWVQRPSSPEVKEELCYLFQYKVQIFLMEMLSVLLTPLVLCYSLPSSAEAVLEFISANTRDVEGMGAVCEFSMFDFERYAAEAFPGEKSAFLGESRMDVRQSGLHRVRTDDGKMEKSYLNFKQHHPNYSGDAASDSVIGQLQTYKDMKMMERDNELAMSMLQKDGASGINHSLSYELRSNFNRKSRMMSSHMMNNSAAELRSSITIDVASQRQPLPQLDRVIRGRFDEELPHKEGLIILNPADSALATRKEGESKLEEQHNEQPNPQQRSNSNSYNYNYSNSKSSAQVGDSRRRMQQSCSSPNNSPQLSQTLSQYGRFGRRAFSPSLNSRTGYSNHSNNNSSLHIATESDHYWLAMMQQHRRRDPHGLEQSLLNCSQMAASARNKLEEDVGDEYSLENSQSYPFGISIDESRSPISRHHSHLPIPLAPGAAGYGLSLATDSRVSKSNLFGTAINSGSINNSINNSSNIPISSVGNGFGGRRGWSTHSGLERMTEAEEEDI